MEANPLARFHGKRPTSLAELKEFGDALPTPGLALTREFVARPSDIFIVTYPKCGTTWMQQIVHGLRTCGSMDFEEISMAIPYMETAPMIGLDLQAPQAAEPRAFKSHMTRDEMPRDARYIHIIREPGDAFVSQYHFYNGVILHKDCVPADEFVRDFGRFEQPAYTDYWSHLRSWWPHRDRDDTLVFCYEDMRADLPGTVARVAAFMGIDDSEAIAVSTRQASYEFMKAHEQQFDERFTRMAMEQIFGQPSIDPVGKVRTGRVGDGRSELSADTRALLDQIWQREIAEPLGLASYADLRAQLG